MEIGTMEQALLQADSFGAERTVLTIAAGLSKIVA